MSRKTYKATRQRYAIINGKQTRKWADKDGNPLILPEPPEKRWNDDGPTAAWVAYCEKSDEFRALATEEFDAPVGFIYAQFGCKDWNLIGSKQTENGYGMSKQPKNAALLAVATAEYQKRLHALQVEIDEKYGALMELEDSTVQPDEELKAQAEATGGWSNAYGLFYH